MRLSSKAVHYGVEDALDTVLGSDRHGEGKYGLSEH
jgi:hypothetical protein